MTLELAVTHLDWAELQFLGSLAAEAEARGCADLRQFPPLAALAEPLLNRAHQRHAEGRMPSQLAPIDAGIRTWREFHEHCLRAALWAGERHARRFFPFFDDLTDDEVARLWTCVAAVIETTGLTKAEQADADTLARRVRLGIHLTDWPILAGIVDANRVHENGGAGPDYDALVAPLLKAPLAA